MTRRLERLRRAGEGRSDGSLTRRGALRTMLGLGVVATAGGVVLRAPTGEVTPRDEGCTRRALTGPDDCPDHRVPKDPKTYSPAVNGCGPQKGWDYVPDHPFGYNFYEPCVAHDKCYGTCGTDRARCDADFHRAMEQVCSQEAWLSFEQTECRSLAKTYYNAVDSFGGSPFADGQHEGCDCCEPEETTTTTTAPPPPICAECSCGGVYTEYAECIEACRASLSCFTGICSPVACP